MKPSRLSARVLVATCLAFALGLPALAAAHGDGKGRHAPSLARALERNAARLKLDEPTLARIRDIEDAQKDRALQLREDTKQERAKLRAMLEAPTPDEGAIMRQVDVLGDLKTARTKLFLATLIQVRALLTPEQNQELVKIYEERRAARRERHRGAKNPNPDGEPGVL